MGERSIAEGESSLPFILKRSRGWWSSSGLTTTETVHGRLTLEGDRLTVQWRLARKKTDWNKGQSEEEFESVREATIPLSAIENLIVRRPWWRFWSGPRIVLVASDFRALEAIAQEGGIRLAHPAKLVLDVRRADALVAAEFAGELDIAIAERELARSDERRGLSEGRGEGLDPGSSPTEGSSPEP